MSATLFFLKDFQAKFKPASGADKQGGRVKVLPIDGEMARWRRLISDANINNAVIEIIEQVGWVCVNPDADPLEYEFFRPRGLGLTCSSLIKVFATALREIGDDRPPLEVLTEYERIFDHDYRFCLEDLNIRWLKAQAGQNTLYTSTEVLQGIA